MRDKHGVAHDKYCYPNSDVLINVLDIRNSNLLDEAKAEFIAERYRIYEPPQPTLSDFSFKHLQQLHFHLFQDLFCELNLLPPFGGVKRAGSSFCFLKSCYEELLYSLGYEVSWPQISQQDWIDANIAGVNLDLSLLIDI